jgi:hypothetical protein
LVKESDNLGETKNKMVKHLKLKFETCYKLKIGVNNVDTFVDKNVLRYRFCGVLLSTWENFCGQVLFLTLLLVPICAVFGTFFQCAQDQILLAGSVGILASAILILVDKSINLGAKKRMLRLNLLDYLENFCKVRLEQEAFHPELLEEYRREYAQVIDMSKQISVAAAQVKEDPKDELNRRREARKKKEEERKLQAKQREEEQRKIEEARKEEERRKLEERRQLAARRREEELLKMEEEREALEARRAEAKKKAAEKQKLNERKQQHSEEKEKILHSLEEELKTSEARADMNMLMQGLDEIAAEKEHFQLEKEHTQVEKEHIQTEKEQVRLEKAERDLMDKEPLLRDRTGKEKQQKVSSSKPKNQNMTPQEEKLIEDVLKEFFA